MPKPNLVSNPRRNTYHGLEDATQSYEAGEFLSRDQTSGETRAMNPATGEDGILCGLAQADASGVTGTDVPVTQIYPGDIVALDTYDTNAAADKAAEDFVPGELYALYVASNEWFADHYTSSTNIKCLICEGIVQGSLRDDLAGTTIYRGLFRFIDASLDVHVGA